MRRLSAAFLVFGLGLLLPSPAWPADDFKLEPGFTLLFNGKNLDGWKEANGKKKALDGKTEAYNGRFKVVEGKLVYDPAVKGDLYIETAAEFGKDCHIKFDFKPGAKCNNDLFVRGTKFDIIPGNKENKNVKEGEWYTFEIVVSGDKVEHKINGETVRTAKAGAKATPFKLRAELGAIEIKNIRVKESADPAALPLIRSAKSGAWSAGDTWEGGKVPGAGARVQVRTDHRVVYDVQSDIAIRSIHVAGTLSFAADQDTRLNVGLIKIQAGEDASENGFDCDAHLKAPDPNHLRPALEVGTADRPIDAKHTAIIRLAAIDGLDRETCPAIICCGGRLDFHGTPMNRTWVKLGATAKVGDSSVTLAEAVSGWRIGDRVIVTATKLTHDIGQYGGKLSTEDRIIKEIDGTKVTLDKPLEREHLGSGDYRGEVANLSRNVVVESADPAKARGHTMYHKYSTGSIGYAEFRHLGKEGLLGKYALHYHLCGDSMRGSSVIGASIWDSANRWLTIHGTSYLVVRDCVGYQSIGHGFFLEDGTEVQNVLDRNLAVQALRGKPLPKQALPFDQNEGAGFWWANSQNTFTRNVACENHRYGYRFEATKTSALDLTTLSVPGPDGERKPTDIRTLPFVRFEGNEAHCDGLYGCNLGEGVNRVGPDEKHPFIVRDLKLWEVHYAFRPQVPCLLVEDLRIHRAEYGVYHPNYDRHVYRRLLISETDTEPFNRGHDDDSIQYGVLVVDGLTFAGNRNSGMPLIQMSDHNPGGTAESHFRNVKVIDRRDGNKRALVNRGGGPRPTPKTPTSVPVYLHDWYGPGQDAKVLSTAAKDFGKDGLTYTSDAPLTGDESRVAKVTNVKFPDPLMPVDDVPPATVITRVERLPGHKVRVTGTTSDNGTVTKVTVQGQAAKALSANFSEWEAVLSDVKEGAVSISAHAEDAAGNVEKRAHVVVIR